jgi:phosphoribosylamine--glycine ligase
MKVLVIGGGGREHAIVWKLAQSPKVTKLYAAPGNAGISRLAECLPIKAEDIPQLVDFARKAQIDLAFCGPEQPLVLGLVDEFKRAGLTIVGPDRAGARLEASKAYAKQFMTRLGIPTAPYEIFDNPQAAKAYLRHRAYPVVIKADGLAAGKGVVIAQNLEEGLRTIDQIMIAKIFGSAGDKVVIEEYLSGQELSFFCFTDGTTVYPLASARDYKRSHDGDKGLNTGGMGSYSPNWFLTPEMENEIMERIALPVIRGLQANSIIYQGILYIGLMLTLQGPQVLEFNVRFGDPETQVILPRLKTDLVEVLLAIAEHRLHKVKLEWMEDSTVCVVLASGGYPQSYEVGKPILGLEELNVEDGWIFHAGTAYKRNPDDPTGPPHLVTSGGRVLGVTARGKTLEEARVKVYKTITRIHFDGMHYRKDIGSMEY